jgi:hypothetical protein
MKLEIDIDYELSEPLRRKLAAIEAQAETGGVDVQQELRDWAQELLGHSGAAVIRYVEVVE